MFFINWRIQYKCLYDNNNNNNNNNCSLFLFHEFWREVGVAAIFGQASGDGVGLFLVGEMLLLVFDDCGDGAFLAIIFLLVCQTDI